MQIRAYAPADRQAVLELSVRAWAPVFPALRAAVPDFVYEAFYPQGWRRRQVDDLAAVLDADPDTDPDAERQVIDVAVDDRALVGWVCTRIHPEDRMGEISVLAVDPAAQRRGIGTALMERAVERIRAAGMQMVMVETGDDPGHAAARVSYERFGFRRWPVARYFKNLRRPDG